MNNETLRDRIPTRCDSLETWRLFRESLEQLSSTSEDVQFAIGYSDRMIARMEQERDAFDPR